VEGHDEGRKRKQVKTLKQKLMEGKINKEGKKNRRKQEEEK
jgi:hypothetical protein